MSCEINVIYTRYGKLRQRIASELFGGIDPGEVINTAGTGDKHMSDCVRRLDTSQGCVLYYKPRDCRCSELLGEINGLLFGEKMVPEQVRGEGYAFQKAVPVKLPYGINECTVYYTRLGYLWAIFYALGSTDMHSENIIPSGDMPVVTDTETLLCARVKGFSGAGDFSKDYGDIFPELRMSAGESMILPRFYAKMQKCPLILDNHEAAEYCLEAFERGAAEGYRMVMAHRAEIGNILGRYTDIPIRFLTRSTVSYYRIMMMYHSARGERSREDVLKRLEKGLKESDLVRWKGIIECERRSIIKGDIPYFSINSGETCLRAGDTGEISAESFAEISPTEYAKERMSRMTEPDLAVQLAYIHGAVCHTDLWIKSPDAVCSTDVKPLTTEDALSEALYALRELDVEKISLGNGCVIWHVPLISGKPASLYGFAEGFSGNAYFCRALASSPLAGDDEKRLAGELADGCFADMRAFGDYLLDYYRTPASEHDIYRRFEGGFGFTDGLAGYLFALGAFTDKYPDPVHRITAGLRNWGITDTFCGEIKRFLQSDTVCDNDTLFNGDARRAAVCLARYDSGDRNALVKAGTVLCGIREHRLKNGSYMLFEKNRRQYFLPTFLRGSIGIAHIMLRYAERLCGYKTGGQEWTRIK